MSTPVGTVVLTNASVVVNSVDLSDHVESVKITLQSDALEDTAMGASYHTKKPGLKVFAIEVTFYQDYNTSKVDQTLFGLVGNSTLFPVVVKADAANTTNTTYTTTNMMLDGPYLPVSGKVGEIEKTTAKFIPGSGFTLVRS